MTPRLCPATIPAYDLLPPVTLEPQNLRSCTFAPEARPPKNPASPSVLTFSPQMLFVDVSSAFQVVQICITALFGIFGVAAALNGYLYRPIPLVLRLAMAVGGLCMMIPGTVSDIIGFVLAGALRRPERPARSADPVKYVRKDAPRLRGASFRAVSSRLQEIQSAGKL